MSDEQLRFYKAYFEIRGTPTKIIGQIPYNSESLPIDDYIEILKPGVFNDSLKSGRDVKAYWGHDRNKVLGSTKARTLKLTDSLTALKIELDPGTTTWGQDALKAVSRGDVTGFSFGFTPIKTKFSDDLNYRYVESATLWEVSPTGEPAYPASKAYARSLRAGTKESNFRKVKNFFNGSQKKMKKNYAKVDKIFSKNPWDSNHEYLRAVINATAQTRPEDIRLERATGLGEGHATEGGFLTKKELIDTWLYGETSSDLYRQCAKVPVGEGFFEVKLPMIHETSRAEGSHLGGLRLYFEDEADAVETSTPKIRSNSLALKKAIGICPITDELMSDDPRMESFLSNVFGRALMYTIDQSILRGSGSGRPLGLLNAPGTLTIAKEAGQDAATIVSQNILNMVAALPAESHGAACWVVNPECLEQLYSMQLEVGTGGGATTLWKWKAGGELYNKLAGFDVLPNEHCSALGQTGDIFLADLSQYAIFEKRIRETISAHLYFLTDESAFRLVYRFDGQPLWNAPITPKHGTSGNKISPFIKLAERS